MAAGKKVSSMNEAAHGGPATSVPVLDLRLLDRGPAGKRAVRSAAQRHRLIIVANLIKFHHISSHISSRLVSMDVMRWWW
jgi:hypothetical protein